MKKLVIIFICVLLIAGGTIGVMKYMGLGPFHDPNAVVEEPEPDEEEALYVDVPALIVNVVQEGKIVASIQLEIKMETLGEENIIDIKRALPRYSDAFVKDLHSFVPRMLREIERLDLPTLKQRLQLVADRVAGEKGKVRDVLIQSIIDTPIK